MLKHKVLTEDGEMKQVQCGMTEQEIPQYPEEIDICTRGTQVIEVLDSEDERKDNNTCSQEKSLEQYSNETYTHQHEQQCVYLQWERERKDPPIKSDRPPGPTKENRKISEHGIIEQRKRDAPISVPKEASIGVKRKLEKNPASDSPDMSTRQSSEITPANIISIKRPLKRSTRLYGVTNIPTFEYQHFIHMDKAKALHDYLMSNEGQEECRKEPVYKSASREDCITGKKMLDQLKKGGKGQMEATMRNALFEEWTEHKQYNISDKAILTAEFANLVLGLKYKDGGLKEFNEDDSLQQFEAIVKGENLLDKKLIMIPHNTALDQTLYVLNKYENRLDILDSLNYKLCSSTTWRDQHRSHKELVCGS
ncbi:hypothetical protein D1007_15601 [Hordeum vulgare]|nr:hypothetical protein D1007_15601 [Hordeum vulgare]